jgi:hypothetical protein
VIAADLSVDEDIVFGRLYNDMNKRYSYKHDDNIAVEFFALGLGAVHFPYLASVLAGLNEQHYRFWIPTVVSVLSIAVAASSLVVAMFSLFGQ